MALQVTGSINVSGSISGSMSGSFQGDGSKLTGVGGTNPTTGSMPLNISGAFVDSPITATIGTVDLTLSEFDSFSVGQESSIINSGGSDSVIVVSFNVGQATGLVDGMTYASYSTSFGGNTDVYTLTWTYIAESNPDRAFGVGSSKLYAFGDATTTSDRGTTVGAAGLLIPPTAYSASLTPETTVTGNLTVSGSISGSMSGSFQGDGSKLTGVGGGTNPTTGSMPLNISGAFVDSPITAQNAGFTPNADNGITYTEVTPNNIFTQGGNICISDTFLGISPSFGTAFEAASLGGSGFEMIAVNDTGVVGPFIESNYNNNNPLFSSLSSITTPFPVTYTDGDGDTLTVRISSAANNSGLIYMGGTGINGVFQPSDFIDGNGSYNEGSGVTSPTTLAFGGVEAEAGTTITSPLTVTQNVSIGGTIGGVGESTISLTTSEINQVTFGNGVVNSKGNVDYINFNTGQATNLVDNQTYSAVTLGSSTNYPSNDPSTYTREWVYLAQGNADLNLGTGNSILYTDNPTQLIIYDDTGNRSLNDYNSPAGLGQLDVATAVGSGGALTTTGGITVTGDITGRGNIILIGGDNVSLPTINYSLVGSGFETDILWNGDATTDVVYLTFNTGSGVGLEDGVTYSSLTFDDGTSKTFTTNWIYIDESSSDRAFPVGESRLYAYQNGATYQDDSNSYLFTTLSSPSSYEVSPLPGDATIGNTTMGNIKSSGIISKDGSSSAKYYIEDSGALPNAEGPFKFKIADNGDLGTAGYITFVRE